MADTEEKKHQPTETKLRRMRREGQVAHSRDLITLAVIPVLLWLAFDWRSFEGALRRLMAGVLSYDFQADPLTLATKLVPQFFWTLFWIIVPIFLLVALLVLLLSIADTKGLVVSMKPLAPKFERLNPGDGFKKIFSARTATESILALLKMLVFALIALGVTWGALDTIKSVQACGMRCLPEISRALIMPLIILASGVFLLSAIADYLQSRAIYRFEMRMSDTELKRENKDTFGNPEFKRHRRDQGRQLLNTATRLGISAATVVIQGRDEAIGIRYVAGETVAPVIVVRGRGAGADELLAAARAAGTVIVNNPALATVLARRGTVGQFVPTDTFTEVAAAIIASGG